MDSIKYFCVSAYVLLFSITYGQTISPADFAYNGVEDIYYIQNELLVTYHAKATPKLVGKISSRISTANEDVDDLLNKFDVVEMTPLETADSMFILKCDNCDLVNLKSQLEKSMLPRFL